MPFPQPRDRLAFAQALAGRPRKLRTNAPNAALSLSFGVACSLPFAICHFALAELQPGLAALCTTHVPPTYLACTSHVPGFHLPISSQAHGLYHACTWLVPGLKRPPSFCILPSAFAPAWLWAAL